MSKAAVITTRSDCYYGKKPDLGGPAAAELLREAGFDVCYTALVPDDRDRISAEFIKCSYELKCDLIISVGGTGFGKRDVTPEATRDVVSREVPAIPQAMLHYSLGITPNAMLTRATAGIRGKTLIINLPGSEKAVRENLGAVLPVLGHALHMLDND